MLCCSVDRHLLASSYSVQSLHIPLKHWCQNAWHDMPDDCCVNLRPHSTWWCRASVMAFSLCCYCHAYVCIAYRYIRFIYNRVILENAPVRAAAVAAMAQFGATCPDLLPNVQVVQLLPSLMWDLLLCFIRCQQLKAWSDMTKLKKRMVWYLYCLCSVSQSTLCAVLFSLNTQVHCLTFSLVSLKFYIVCGYFPILFWREFRCMPFLIMRNCLFAV